MFGFNVWNTWTILLEALSREYIGISDTESAINELADGRHKLKSEQAIQVLEAAKLIDSVRKRKG